MTDPIGIIFKPNPAMMKQLLLDLIDENLTEIVNDNELIQPSLGSELEIVNQKEHQE